MPLQIKGCRQTHKLSLPAVFLLLKIIRKKPLISVPGAPFPQARLQLIFAADRRKNGFSAHAFLLECRAFHYNQLLLPFIFPFVGKTGLCVLSFEELIELCWTTRHIAT
ncbi:hypothetical protein [Lysinibacillus sp. 54212]|uniref:hypothetical protein n=1 Tax=Lysinibacillus sp. 54212 TaxID=3119829 RepID=UPI002FCC3CCB